MQQDTYRVSVDDRAELQIHRWLPDGEPRATIQIVHGISERASRYHWVAEALAEAGYAVYAHDQRGHGLTTTPEQVGFVAATGGWQRLIDDLMAVYCHISEKHPDQQRVMIGHSMGSLLAQHFAIEHGSLLDALVLCATTYRPDIMPTLGEKLAETMIRRRGPTFRSRLLDFLSVGALRMTVRNRRTEFDWLSRDPAVIDAYIADPLCGGVPSVALWRDVYQGVRFIAKRANQARIPRKLPILFITGGADVLSGGGRGVAKLAESYRSLGIEDVTCTIYPGARHELFNEINRTEVYADLIDWLDMRLTAPQTIVPSELTHP